LLGFVRAGAVLRMNLPPWAGISGARPRQQEKRATGLAVDTPWGILLTVGRLPAANYK
jgi:hypothetical protein